MAINKTFVAHTELKAQDLNELVDQANAADAAEKARAEADLAAEVLARDAAIATEQARAEAEEAKKPNKVELYGRDNSEPLPMDATYYYNGMPTHSVTGVAYDSSNEVYTSYIGICIEHEADDSYEPQHHNVKVFVKTGGNYMYSETFNTSEASGYLENHIARALGSLNATPSYSGLMSPIDKADLTDVVRETFPLTVVIASSNAGTYETGTSVSPEIQLNITRRGRAISVPAEDVTVTPSGSFDAQTKIVSDSAISSGSRTYNISVQEGGQTKEVNAGYSFSYYRYKGVLSSKPNTSNIVAAIRALPKELSTVATLGQTTLEANKYYLFAVKGNVTLIVKNAKSGGTISVPSSDKGTVMVPQENGQGSNTYSWIIVPASTNTWYFQITNS